MDPIVSISFSLIYACINWVDFPLRIHPLITIGPIRGKDTVNRKGKDSPYNKMIFFWVLRFLFEFNLHLK